MTLFFTAYFALAVAAECWLTGMIVDQILFHIDFYRQRKAWACPTKQS